ncbi:hypothetical protein F7R06_23120 [Pseudomonas moorei]|nr:hypothetical protein F7R06_23120 [Pseudomonas moorei]PTT97698.1 hypothetical protein DBR45_37065 [Pseudomonas sp. HMWF031]
MHQCRTQQSPLSPQTLSKPSLLAIAPDQPSSMLNVKPPSRASSLPQDLRFHGIIPDLLFPAPVKGAIP